jgi:U3 small nucleolar RNA-associated protein 21
MNSATQANLSHLADIRRRNKPTEAPKAPKHAPFFLPTLAGLETQFDLAASAADLGTGTSKVLNFGKIGVKSPFQQLLCTGGETEDYSALLAALMKMGPAAIDLEIRSLSLENDVEQLRYFLKFIACELKARKHFELAQSYMHLFLQVHGETIGQSPHLLDVIKTVTDEQSLSWIHIEGLFQHSLCVLSFLRGGGL